MTFNEQEVSDLLKRLRAAATNQSLPQSNDLAAFRSLARAVHVIDGLSFRQHFGEVMLYLLGTADSIPESAPDLSSKPTATSSPPPTSKPTPSSVVNPVFEEPSIASKPQESSAPNDTSKPPDISAPPQNSKPDEQSNLFCVRTTQFWACDNQTCGHDDLIMELQLPSGKRKTEQIRYQCLKCVFVGTAELTREEIEKAMKEEKRVTFEIGKTNVFDFLNEPRPAGKKRKGKAQDAQPGEPKGTPLLDSVDAVEAGDQHMNAIAQEVRQSQSQTATQAPQAPSPSVLETQANQAPQPPAIQSGGKKTKKGGTAEATPFQQAPAPAQNETPAAVKKAVEKVITAQVSPSEVIPEEMLKTLTSTVQGWPLERLIKDWESMTGKVYKQGVTVPDAMVTEVVYQLAGVPMNA